jgi:hypothetical protein
VNSTDLRPAVLGFGRRAMSRPIPWPTPVALYPHRNRSSGSMRILGAMDRIAAAKQSSVGHGTAPLPANAVKLRIGSDGLWRRLQPEWLDAGDVAGMLR